MPPKLRILALLFLVAAHAGPSEKKEAFRFRLQTEPATLDWTNAHTNYETYVLMNLMEGLVEIDRKLTPAPALAERWDVSDDGLTYTFHLRPGVKWSDGAALKAQDFVYSWKRLLTSSNEYTSFLYDVKGAEDFNKGRLKNFEAVGVKALDASCLQVKLRRVVPYFVTLLSFWVTFPQRQDLVEKHKKDWTAPAKLVTLGPYRLASWTRERALTFERNPLYYGEPPSVERVEAIVEKDEAAARRLLDARKIDALLEVTTQDISKYATDASQAWTLRHFTYLATDYLAFHAGAAPTKNVHLRQALARAIDRAGIPRALQGGQLPADSLIVKGLAGYDPQALEFSIENAKKELQAAGFADGSEVPPLVLVARKGAQEDAARFVAAALKKNLGVKVDVKAVAAADFKSVLKAGRFSMYLGHWGADYPDASSFMEIMLSSSGNNYTRWKSAEYDKLVTAAGGSLKVLERLKMYADAQRILFSDGVAMAPLFYPQLTALVGSRVADFEISPLNYLFFKRLSLK